MTPMTMAEIKRRLDQRKRVIDTVRSELGPTSLSTLAGVIGVNRQSITNITSTAGCESYAERSPARQRMTERIESELPDLNPAAAAARLRAIADLIERTP